MALRFMDSFDHYATPDILEKWSQAIPNSFEVAPVISLTGRHSSNGIRWLNANYAGRPLVKSLSNTSGPTVVIGFGWRQQAGAFTNLRVDSNLDPSYYNSCNFLLAIRQASVTHVWFRINNNGSISAMRGQGGSAVLATTTNILPLQAYVYIEFKVLVDTTNGTVDIRVNNEEWMHLTNLNTQYASQALWNELIIGGVRCYDSSGALWDYDDLYVLDGTGPAPWNDFLGDCRVDACYPTAEGAASAWEPLSGLNNAAMVNQQVPDDDVTYNSTTAIGATDTFVVGDAVPGSLLRGVQVNIHTKKADAGPCTLAPVVAGVQGAQTVNPNSGVSYSYALFPYAINPATGLEWTEASFNAAEFGYTRTA
jgi:hypothetical protein